MIGIAEDRAARFAPPSPASNGRRSSTSSAARGSARLDREGQVYRSTTPAVGNYGGGSQVRRHMELLLGSVLGNPHSTNPTSAAATHYVECCCRRVSPSTPIPGSTWAIFTCQCQPGAEARRRVGIRSSPATASSSPSTTTTRSTASAEFDRAHGAETIYVPVTPPELRVDEAALDLELAHARIGGHNLFAYPAQSNFSGAASAGVDRAPRNRAGTCCSMPRRSFAVEPARPLPRCIPISSPCRSGQDVWLSDRESGAAAPERLR